MSVRAAGRARGPGSFANRVIGWQRTHGRNHLPWQNTRDPYRVWLSEIMLQQTQVSTVLPYYERFLQRFPDVQALAAASLDDVLSLWSGLGYYARGRNLHRCAQVVVSEHGGQFPPCSEKLAELPGIGRSTAAAIAAFCFAEKVAILDGNVKRVLGRVLAFEGDLANAAQVNALWNQATALLPNKGIEAYTQGLMDLGATICALRSPKCLLCPVNDVCAAQKSGSPESFPLKTRRLKRSRRESDWLWLRWKDSVWLTQRPSTGIWAALWSLPEFEGETTEAMVCEGWPGDGRRLPEVTHTLTHLDWLLRPLLWVLPDDIGTSELARVLARLPEGRWFTVDEALESGVPAPLRKLILGHRAG